MNGEGVRGVVPVGVPGLLVPKWRGRINQMRVGGRNPARLAVLGAVTLLFWGLIFAVVHRMLLYFRGAEEIGDILSAKLLGLALLTFLMILLLSNVIAALSTFFLSRDLELLVASPADPLHVYWARLLETGINSSWMVVLMSVPLLAGYGVVYGAGPGYYLLAAVVMTLYLALPAVAGTAVTLFLVNVFPARRMRDLLAFVGFLAAVGAVVLLRLLRPERLVRPDEFRSLVAFTAELRTPSSPWLPSEWATSALMSWLEGSFDLFPLFLLASTAAAFLVLGGWLHALHYHTGFSRAQEGAERTDRGRVTRAPWERVLERADPLTRELVSKEIRVFLRDSTQWSQLVLLAVLVAVYVYNIRVLPISTSEELSFFLVNLIGFLNLGLAGFVVAAIAARFVFPAISLEGRMNWLLRSSPLEPERLFRIKFWVGALPLLVIALPLIVITNRLLDVSTFLMVVSTLTMLGVTLAFAAMALALGAIYPNYETENPAEIPTSFGGLLFMMAAVAYLVVVVVLEAWPVYLFLRARLDGTPFLDAGLAPLILGFGGAAALTAFVIAGSLRVGVARIRVADISIGEGA
jgi:ABC-2 type transport system permease protein